MPTLAPVALARFHQMPMTSAGKNDAPARLNAHATSSTMSDSRKVAMQAATMAVTTSSTLVMVSRLTSEARGVDDVVVEVVGDRVGDGEQQAVGRGQRGGEAAGHDEAGDHERQPGDLGRGQHDEVAGLEHEVGPLHDAVAVLVDHVEQAGRLPQRHPARQLADLGADQPRVEREPREGGVGRRREVQQEDAEERPRRTSCAPAAPTARCSSA